MILKYSNILLDSYSYYQRELNKIVYILLFSVSPFFFKFSHNNITENQDGVDEATGKLTQLLPSISDKACKTFHKSERKKKKKKRQTKLLLIILMKCLSIYKFIIFFHLFRLIWFLFHLPPDYVTDTELKRVNQDVIINSHGKNLLDLCLSSRLRILNGRFLGDSLGYFTYMSNNGFSSVDYAILNH
jgi:hypothetical protein